MTEFWGARLAAHDGRDATRVTMKRGGERHKELGVRWEQRKSPQGEVSLVCPQNVVPERKSCFQGQRHSYKTCVIPSSVEDYPRWGRWRCELLLPDVFCSLLCEQMLSAGCSLLFLAGGSSNKILISTFEMEESLGWGFLGALCAAIA